MTAKEYLEQVYCLDQEINSKLEQICSLRSLTQKVTVTYESEPVVHTRNVSSLEDTIIRLIEAEDDLNQQIDRLVDLKMEIAACIAKIDNQSYRTLLEKRYLCFQSWEQIAIDMQFTVRWALVLHGRALNEIGKLLRPEDTTRKDKLEGVH